MHEWEREILKSTSLAVCSRLAGSLVCAAVMALLALLATNEGAAAATLTVTTEDDEGGASGNTGACSLREAILA